MKKIAQITIAFILILTFVVPQLSIDAETVSNEETVLYLTRDEAKERLIEDSNVLRSLYRTRDSLLTQYSDLKDQIDGLKSLYDLLPRYRKLYDKQVEMESNEDLMTYFELLQAKPSLESRLDEIESELAGLEETTDPEELAKKGELETEKTEIAEKLDLLITLDSQLTEEEKDSMMTFEEIYELQIYQTQFAVLGIDSPKLSNESEYEMFIQPIYITTNDFLTSIRSFELTIKNTEASLINGVDQLYTTLLSLEEVNQLLEESYKIKETDLEYLQKQFELGQVSSNEVAKAENELKKAELEKAKMARQIQSLEMSFKQMLGLENSVEIVLEDKLDLLELKSMETYIQSALENRNELETIRNSKDAKAYEMRYIEEYFRESSNEYKIVSGELVALELELQQNELEIEKEIMTAYNDVLLKKQAYLNAEQALKQAETQYKEVEKYVELGFVTQHSLDSLGLLVIQSKNAKISAYRDYAHAVLNLESASDIGPAYSSSEGGITVE